MARGLVVYFSRTGATEKFATQLAARLGAGLESVMPATPYSGGGGYLKAIWHSLVRRAPAIDCRLDPSDYSVVVIGSPVWAGRLSAPMRSYLTRFRGRIGHVAAFWVSGSGQGYSGVGAEIEQLAGQKPLTTVSLSEREVRSDAAGVKLEALAQAIRARLPDVAARLDR